MSRMLRRIKSKGFTLVELLVVIGIIAILAALLFPAIQGALTKAKMVKTMNNGRSIYQALMAVQLEREAQSLPSVYPKSSDYPSATKTSTDFWIAAYTNNWLEGFDFSFFSAPGVDAPVNPTNVTGTGAFSSTNNAWCIILDYSDGDPSSMPLVFTKNVGKGGVALVKGTDKLSDINSLVETAVPYGNKGACVVTKGGAAKVVKKEEMNWTSTGTTPMPTKDILLP